MHRAPATVGAAGPLLPWWLPLSCLLVAGFKLWLVAGDELVARANPLDQVRYLEMAQELAHGRWLGAYGPLTLIREPGYPGWVAVVHLLGPPLRLATEVLLLAAAALFCAGLWRAGVSAGVALAAYAVLALEPHSLVVNRDALPAGFYLALLLCGLAGLIWCVRSTNPRRMVAHAGWAGLVLGVLWVTRPEKPLLLIPVGVMASWDLIAGWRAGVPWRSATQRAAIVAGVPLCGIAVVAVGVAASNQHHYGVFAATGVTGPGYLAANRALLSIEHAAPRRFVPVPRDVRERAYRASPALRELRPTLEGPSWARGVSCKLDGVCDDIGAGYFRWLLREAAAATGHMGSHSDGEVFFRRIADEITTACRSGALRCRRSSASFLHPYPETWRAHLVHSIRRVAAKAFGGGDLRVWDAALDSPREPKRVRRLFDEVANRRPERTDNGRVVTRGRVVAETDPVVSASLHTTWQRVASRADSPGASGGVAGGVSFHFEIDKRTRDFGLAAPALVLERESGATTKIPLPRAADRSAARDGVQLFVETYEETGVEGLPRRAARSLLWIAHPFFYAALAALGLLAAAALLLPFRSDRFRDPALGVFAMLAALVAARFALLILIDASSFPARSSRYVYPAVSLTGCALLLLVEQGVRNLRHRRSGR